GVEAERRLGVPLAVVPQAGARLEDVVGQEAPAVGGHQVNRVEDAAELRLAQEIVEVDPHPSRLDALTAAHDLALELLRGLEVDAEEAVAIGTGAGAAGARLDPEEIVQQARHEIVVEVAVAVADDE